MQESVEKKGDENGSAADLKEHPLQQSIRELMEEEDRLYGVVDAARDLELASIARTKFKLKSRSLFEGELAPYLEHVAPHLVMIDPESPYLRVWNERLGKSAGILLITTAEFEDLWHHLRSLFIMEDHEEEECSFRYYDPRVLRSFLPTCTAEECDEFFGPMRMILAEAAEPDVLLNYRHDEEGLMCESIQYEPGTTGKGDGEVKP